MVLPPRRLTGEVLTRLTKYVPATQQPDVKRAESVQQTRGDFDALLREETRLRAARLCHYAHHKRGDGSKG
jgi:hypothetical protein